MELSEKALEMLPNAQNLDTLAAAYAEAGRFDDAIETQERAIRELDQAVDGSEMPELKKRLEYYHNKRPWRDMGASQ